MQRLLNIIYPPRCLTCDEHVEKNNALCGHCWRETPFIIGAVCNKCGTPLVGEDTGENSLCDDCIRMARPWARGRSAMVYSGNGRNIILRLKHGDRSDLALSAAVWMSESARNLRRERQVIVPVPLHWTRFLKRRFNQSALLAKEMAKLLDASFGPDFLVRNKRTSSLDGLNREERFQMTADAITAHPKRIGKFRNRPILLVDDVMTSGATLAACADACLAAGAENVDIVTLARVAKSA